jgi:8-oxo-dGTP diphosphatase
VNQGKQWQSNVLAGAATVHDGLFLLLKRSKRESFLPDVWGIPAGQVQQAEDPGKACGRELLEETGIRGEVIQLIGYSTFQSRRGGVELSNVQLNFLVLADDDEVRIDEASHSAYRWIPLDDTDSDLLDPFTKEVMLSARRYYKELATR